MRRFLAWWRQASPAWCWGLPLAVLAAVLALDWLRLHAEGVATPAEARHLLLRVGLVAGAAGIVMVVGVAVTEGRWRLQGLGLLAFLLGAFGLCARVIAHWGPQPVREWERDLYQSALEVGSNVLALGLVMWVVGRLVRHEGSEAPSESLATSSGSMPSPPHVVSDRRRNTYDRRANPPPPRPGA